MSIWLEVRISQGRNVDPRDSTEINTLIEAAFDDIASRNIFCEPEGNFMFCFVRLDRGAVPVSKVVHYNKEISRIFQEQEARGLDEVNIVDAQHVGQFFPGVVR